MQPVQLVYHSILYAVAAGLFLFIYTYIYPKKPLKPLMLVILLALPPIVSIFRQGTYESGDLSLHTMRTMSFYHVLITEHTIPRWTPEFNASYGDPYFLFSYFLVYFMGSILHLLGLTFLTSQKIILASSFILSGVFMYLYMKEEINEKAGVVAAIFYLYAPYHLVDLHFRVTIAEVMSFMFLPLILLFTRRNILNPTKRSITLGALSYALLILCHQAIALFFIPLSFIYACIVYSTRLKSIRQFLPYFVMLGLGLLTTCFYWLPIILEAKYTRASLEKGVSFFPQLSQLIYSPWRYGFLFQGHFGELSFIIGYTQLLVIAVITFYVLKRKFIGVHKRLVLFFLTLLGVLTLLMLPFAKPIWYYVPFLKFFQYSFRLLEVVALSVSILAGMLSTRIAKKSVLILLCAVTIGYTILNWGNRRMLITENDKTLAAYYQKHPDIGLYLEPSSPVWTDLIKAHLRQTPLLPAEMINGKGKITLRSKTALTRVYDISALTPVRIKENTLYFPGWIVEENKTAIPITYTDNKYPGVITYTLPKGEHHLIITFTDTLDRKIGYGVTIVTLVMGLVFLFTKTKFDRLFFSNNSDIPSIKSKRKIKPVKSTKNKQKN